MSSTDIVTDIFDRVRAVVHRVVEGLTPEQLSARIDEHTNTIAWLLWHLTRVQDDHIADAADTEQVWTSEGWSERFGLPFDVGDTGYGHTSDQVGAVRLADPGLLTGYYDAVHARTATFVGGLDERDLSRVVDTAWNPPVTLATRLVSVVSDDLQHAGQAALLRGVIERATDAAG